MIRDIKLTEKDYYQGIEGLKGVNTDKLLTQSMIKEYIKQTYDKQGNVYLGLVHRLDRPTGGVMVFAKTSKAATRPLATMDGSMLMPSSAA